MKIPRRRILQLAAGAAALPAASRIARAQAYPSRPVRIVVGYTAGGVSDILARLIGQRLTEKLGQPFVVEDRPGAASNVGADVVVHAPADGYTLFLAGISNAINVALYPDLDFNFVHDMTPIAIFSRSPLVMEVNPSFPAKTVPEFIAYAKANPGTINMGSAGTGGATHVAGELFQMMTGTKFFHVPYRGSPPALADLLAGRTQVMFDNVAASIALIRDGKLRPLAVSSRTEALPDVAADQRLRAGLRGLCMEWYHRAERLSGGRRRQTERGGQWDRRRSRASRLSLPTLAIPPFRIRLRASANSSSKTPRNGRRS